MGKVRGRGVVTPVVDFARCEGKGPCVPACPYDVFEVTTIKKQDFDQLSFFKRLKNKAHGGKVAYAVRASACEACGLCVSACPESAIRLVPAEKPV